MGEAHSYIQNKSDNYESKEPLLRLLILLIRASKEPLKPKICEKFVTSDEKKTNIVVTNCPHPKNLCKFLYHVLMFFGQFESENQLFIDYNFKKAFVSAGLCNDNNLMGSFHNLMRKIIIDLFAWLPISAKKLSRCIELSHDSTKDFFSITIYLHQLLA